MDSLLYVGGADDDDDDDEDDEEEEEGEEAASAAEPKAAAPVVDYAALQRAGFSGSAGLASTETYQRLSREEEQVQADKLVELEREERERTEAAAAEDKARSNLLDKKKIDERVGYKKRYDETREDFRSKEKRKRQMGQQNSGGDWVQEEKRSLRHQGANFDS